MYTLVIMTISPPRVDVWFQSTLVQTSTPRTSPFVKGSRNSSSVRAHPPHSGSIKSGGTILWKLSHQPSNPRATMLAKMDGYVGERNRGMDCGGYEVIRTVFSKKSQQDYNAVLSVYVGIYSYNQFEMDQMQQILHTEKSFWYSDRFGKINKTVQYSGICFRNIALVKI